MTQKEFDKQYDEAVEDVNSRASTLSGMVSSLSLYIVGGILATDWTIIYRENGLEIINDWLLYAAILCFVYLAFSLLFYFIDSVYYHKKSIELFDKEGDSKYLQKYKKAMEGRSKVSYIFYYIKFVILIVTSIVFIVGLSQML